ncbi:PAS domain-containing sensor histidine kinase [Methanomassiliicoccus luminyensis]|uniref:PAS domain-containing sensor histidine kinase n=1 Tax=Methanomassiliicoccus luminyensis TaxID=1080712 RepID=UPI0006747B99|nr:PAS domain-containing sensor histidine kinase [Methanomassiliicoccus luminyensis]
MREAGPLRDDKASLDDVTALLRALSSGRLDDSKALLDRLKGWAPDDGGSRELAGSAVALAEQMVLTFDFLNALSEGRLDQDPPRNVPMMGPCKQLHANLRHLLWNLDRIAAGDYSQEVAYLGDFTDAYAGLTASLRQKQELEARLGESERLFRTTVTVSPNLMAITDLEGRIEFISDAGVRFIGWPENALLGQDILRFVVPEQRDHARALIARVISGEELGEHELQAIDGLGHRMRVEVAAGLVRDRSGDPEKIFLIVRDVTWKKELEEELRRSEERYRTLVEAVTTPIFILAPDTQVLYMNEMARRFLSLREGEEPGKFIDYMDESFFPALTKTALDPGKDMEVSEVLLRDAAGRRVWGYLSLREFEYDGSKALLVSCSDITERKKVEEQLALASHKLVLFGSLTRHDVLNLVTVLSGNLQLAQAHSSDDATKRYLERAEQALEGINRQMDLTREYQRLGTVEPEWIEVRAIRNELEGMELGGAALSLDLPDDEILADPLFISCVRNMVENSIKHGGTVREITVQGREGDNGLVISVQDDGKGIPAHDKEKVFEWNYQGRSGHGLHFIREVLNITGMSIRETGQEGTGARFEIVVPPGSYRKRSCPGKWKRTE